MMDVLYRSADMSDLPAIIAFVDYWLTGGGEADGIPGATHDYFVPGGRQKSYLAKYDVMLAIYGGEIVGWAVKTNKGVLIHLLIAATFRGRGIGGEMLRRMNPEVLRSKMDQKSGDPAGFYLKHGFVRASSERFGKRKNIELFVRVSGVPIGSLRYGAGSGRSAGRITKAVCGSGEKHQRSIDFVAERLADAGSLRRRVLD